MSLEDDPSSNAIHLPASAEFARDEGKRFTDANEKFRQLIEEAMLRPSELAIEAVDDQRDSTSRSTEQMHKELFFGATENEELVRAAVGVVLHETEQNWHLTTLIDPDDPSPESFPEGLRDLIVEKLLAEDEENIDADTNMEIDLDDIESWRFLPDDASIFFISSIHKESVENLYKNFRTSGQVLVHTYKQVELERRQDRMIIAGLATIGAFVGTSLALALAQRRKK